MRNLKTHSKLELELGAILLLGGEEGCVGFVFRDTLEYSSVENGLMEEEKRNKLDFVRDSNLNIFQLSRIASLKLHHQSFSPLLKTLWGRMEICNFIFC